MAIKVLIMLSIIFLMLSLNSYLYGNRESLALFENRIKPRVYVRRITRSPTNVCTKKSSIMLAGTGVRNISSVSCGFSSIKIYFSDYSKRLISRIKAVYVFLNKISLQRYFIEKKATKQTKAKHT